MPSTMVRIKFKDDVETGGKFYFCHKELPFSEVCMHMKIAGKTMHILLETEVVQRDGIISEYPPYARVEFDDGTWSAPITYGEAGFYRDDEGYYYHE